MIKAIFKHPQSGDLDDKNTIKVAGLKVDEAYEVEEIDMRSWHTDIFLKGYRGSFNSVAFEFEEDGKPLDIYSDPRFNPFLDE